jgi:hypothetical protein
VSAGAEPGAQHLPACSVTSRHTCRPQNHLGCLTQRCEVEPGSQGNSLLGRWDASTLPMLGVGLLRCRGTDPRVCLQWCSITPWYLAAAPVHNVRNETMVLYLDPEDARVDWHR